MNKKKRIILIGGAPTSGKSYLAQWLSKRMNLPWISTDQIKEIMRTVADKKDYKKLFNPEGYDAEKFLNSFSSEEIVKMEIEQGEVVWIGIKELINNDYTWSEGFIIEGVNILPKRVVKELSNNKHLRVLFLLNENKKKISEVIFSRGLWDEPNNYPDSVKKKEIDWVMLFNKYIKKEAKKYNLPLLTIDNRKDYLKKAQKIASS